MVERIRERMHMSQAEVPAWLRGSDMGELIAGHDWTGSEPGANLELAPESSVCS